MSCQHRTYDPAPSLAHCHPRHPRHSRQLRRIRDLRGRAFHAAGGARPRCDGLLPRASQLNRSIAASGCGISPPSGTSISIPSRIRSSPRSHLLAHRVDVALYCNGANAIFTVLPRLCGMPVALNVDGLERKRKKWNRAAKAWYLVSEWLATFLPNAVVTDARSIQDYYRAALSASAPRSFRTARRPARWNPPACWRSWAWSRGATSCT